MSSILTVATNRFSVKVLVLMTFRHILLWPVIQRLPSINSNAVCCNVRVAGTLLTHDAESLLNYPAHGVVASAAN
jgi:hypothetical protein